MKKIIACILVIMMLGTLAACESVDYVAQVSGTWICPVEESEETRLMLMENLELYEEEIALVDTKLFVAKKLTLNADKTYNFTEDVQGDKDYVRQFYTGMFQNLYEGRANLSQSYDVDISLLSEEEFLQFYAELYQAENYNALIDLLVENAYDYDSFTAIEQGTYSVGSKRIVFDAEDDTQDGDVEYTLEGNKLTIKYSDGTEVYSRVTTLSK